MTLREIAEDWLVPKGKARFVSDYEAFGAKLLQSFAKTLQQRVAHTRECDRWNHHSDGEADFRDSPYRCQCFGQTIDKVLAEWEVLMT